MLIAGSLAELPSGTGLDLGPNPLTVWLR